MNQYKKNLAIELNVGEENVFKGLTNNTTVFCCERGSDFCLNT